MRKILLVLFICLVCLFPAGAVQAAQVYSDGDFYYHACEGYNSICGYFGNDSVVIVPAMIAGQPVCRVEAGAFDGCDTIEKLVLPSALMEIEDGAFWGARNLKEIEDASGVWSEKEQKEVDGSGESSNIEENEGTAGNNGVGVNSGAGTNGGSGISSAEGNSEDGSGADSTFFGEEISSYEYIEPEEEIGGVSPGMDTNVANRAEQEKDDEKMAETPQDINEAEHGAGRLGFGIVIVVLLAGAAAAGIHIRRKHRG